MSWIRFGNPTAFWFLLGLFPVVFFFIWGDWRRRQLSHYFSQQFSYLTRHIRFGRQRLSQFLIVIAYFSLVLACLYPQIGQQPKWIKQSGVDILIAVDLSTSMLAQDIKPNRLEVAKQGISQLLSILEGDRVGLIAFAGSSYIQCPLTTDYSTVKTFLLALDSTTIPRSGTEISRAIQLAINHSSTKIIVPSSPVDKRKKILVFFSDGEDHSQVAVETAKIAKENDIRIYCLGIGRSDVGSPIPIHDEQGKLYGYKRDSKNSIVVSKLNKNLLQEIAQLTGGSYYHLSPSTQEITDLYKTLSSLKNSAIEEQTYTYYTDKFQWPLFVALLCLMAEWLLPLTVSDDGWWKFIRFRS